MPVWRSHPAFGVAPKTRCPTAYDTTIVDTTVVEYGLTLATVLILLANGDRPGMALLVPLTALLGVRAIRTAWISALAETLRWLLGSPGATMWSSPSDHRQR